MSNVKVQSPNQIEPRLRVCHPCLPAGTNYENYNPPNSSPLPAFAEAASRRQVKTGVQSIWKLQNTRCARSLRSLRLPSVARLEFIPMKIGGGMT